MSLIQNAASLVRRQDFDTVRTSADYTAKEARAVTIAADVANTTLYTLCAFTGPIGAAPTLLSGVFKFATASLFFFAGRGLSTPKAAAYRTFAGDLCRSGLENLAVGAAACIPGAGQPIAGIAAARSFAEVAATAYAPHVAA